MSQKSQLEPEGNTKTLRPLYQLYRWFFTLRYEDITASQLSQDLKEISKSFLFSGEIGKDGYKHWQGCFSLKNKEYFNTIKNYFPNSIHLEPCMNWYKAKNYCKKEETHLEGPYDENYIFLETITNLYPWQEEIRNICLSKPDNRSIYWIWEDIGNTGKTSFCKYMAIKHNATVLGNGAFKDIAMCLPNNPEIVLFNLTRDLECRVNYSALEAIKDGLIFSSKYESKMKIFNPPHVFVFANFEPRVESMSLDRWKIIRI